MNYSPLNQKGSNGFTIVELLIVIVVIAILAAVSVVAYNGIQQRAYASKAASVVDGYTKIINMYNVDNGSYVDTDGIYVCTGTVSDYPATGDFAAGQCRDYGYGDTASVNSTVNNLLGEYASSLPSGNLPSIEGRFRGVLYSGNSQGGAFTYTLKGDQACPQGEKDTWDDTTACHVYIGDYEYCDLPSVSCTVT